MRIGTWNLAGRWTAEHHDLVLSQDVDVWLLTEVDERVRIDGYEPHMTRACMAAHRRWAGVFSRSALVPLDDPHPASALAQIGRFYFCSSILPWRSAPSRQPWVGVRHAEKTEHAVRTLLGVLPRESLIWGGDWNHALSGREHAGSIGGRQSIVEAVDKLNLLVPTAALAHRMPGLLSIDHIAVPSAVPVRSAQHVPATVDGRRLSDHDVYVVEVGLAHADDSSRAWAAPE